MPLIQKAFSLLLQSRYAVHGDGVAHIPPRGGVLLFGNHTSTLDWAFIQTASPRPIRFVIPDDGHTSPAMQRLLHWSGATLYRGSLTDAQQQQIRTWLQTEEVVCLFPEEQRSRNGLLQPFTLALEPLLPETGAVTLPFYLQGLWGSLFSLHHQPNRQAQPRLQRRTLQLAFGSPHSGSLSADHAQRLVERLSLQCWQQASDHYPALQAAWVRRSKQMGLRTVLTDLVSGDHFSGIKLLIAATLIARRIEQQSSNRRIGVLLPTTAAGVLTNLAILMRGRTIVNLNYSGSAESISDAIALAELDIVYTSARFLSKLEEKGKDLRPALAATHVVELEQLKGEISTLERLTTALQIALLPSTLLIKQLTVPTPIDQHAAILFSSGSEGKPKGIPLSHRNLTTNIRQIIHALQPKLSSNDPDIMLDSLPLFHSFGLTATTLMPLIEGIPLITAPDPTDTLTIVNAIEQYQATLYVGTPTFLQWMSRNPKVHQAQLQSLRRVISGAEPLKPAVREAFEAKFGKPLYEGYGATEMSPAATVNIPDEEADDGMLLQQGNTPGSVGRPLVGTLVRIVDRETLEPLEAGEDGLILLAGVQQMAGYLCEAPPCNQPFIDLFGIHWYASGDKGHLDEAGFLTIIDRYARFAKMGGEMVSLTAVEEQIRTLLEQSIEVAAVATPDLKRGEQITLFYQGEMGERELARQIRSGNLSPLMIPSHYRPVEEIPLLGSGKRNYGLMKQWALSEE